MYDGFGGFDTILKNNDRIQLIVSAFDEAAALIDDLFDSFMTMVFL